MRPQQQAAPAASDRCDKMTERLDRYTDDVIRDGDLALVGILCCGRRVERQLGDAVAMTYLFKPCDYTQNTSEQIFDLVSAIFPLFTAVAPERAIDELKRLTQGYEAHTCTVWHNHRLVAFGALSDGPNESIATLVGCVAKAHRRQGIGRHLLTELMAACKGFPAKQIVRAQGFRRDQSGPKFLERYQFELSDQLHWSQRAVSEPLPEWALAKLASIRATGIRFTTGQAYAERHSNWEAALWRLHAESARDILSALAKHELTLEQWRTFWQSPENDRARAIIAIHDDQPIALLCMGQPKNETSNINYTGVATAYRRRGLSTALKCQLFEMLESSDVRYISTQNHQNNPMLVLNEKLGFKRVDSILEYARPIDGFA